MPNPSGTWWRWWFYVYGVRELTCLWSEVFGQNSCTRRDECTDSLARRICFAPGCNVLGHLRRPASQWCLSHCLQKFWYIVWPCQAYMWCTIPFELSPDTSRSALLYKFARSYVPENDRCYNVKCLDIIRLGTDSEGTFVSTVTNIVSEDRGDFAEYLSSWSVVLLMLSVALSKLP